MVSNNPQKPDIIIVDDNLNFRQGLIFLITIDNVANVIGKASNEKEFMKLITQLDPDVVLMDISMLLKNEMEMTVHIRKMKPNMKIIAFSMFGDEEYYFKLNNLGVKGFLLKSGGINELEKAIENVMKGDSYVTDQLLKKIIINFVRNNTHDTVENEAFTAFESQLLKYITEGLNNEAIADILEVNSQKVKEYKLELLKKIGTIYDFQINLKPQFTY